MLKILYMQQLLKLLLKKMRLVDIQPFKTGVPTLINLVTKRAFVYENGHMEWIDGNIGSNVNMKYPSCVLLGERAKGTTISNCLCW